MKARDFVVVACTESLALCVTLPVAYRAQAAKQNGRQTHTSAGISRCRSILSAASSSRPRVIVLLTDGAPNL